MKRFFKTLLFTMLLFISTNVEAMEDIMVVSDPQTDSQLFSSRVMKDVATGKSSNIYAFCLDSDYQYSSGETIYRDYLKLDLAGYNRQDLDKINSTTTKVRRVLLKAYSDGLGTGSNVYGLDEGEFYDVTQMAVWHASHGYGWNGYNTNKYDVWLAANSNRKNAFDKLIEAEDSPEYSYVKNGFAFENGKYSMTLSSDGEYYVSEQIIFSAPKTTKYTVSALDGACVDYNNKCTEQAEIGSGEVFILKVKNTGSKEVTASATIVSNKEIFSDYEFSMFMPIDYNEIPYLRVTGDEYYWDETEKKLYEDESKTKEIVHERQSYNGTIETISGKATKQRIGYMVPKYDKISEYVTATAVVESDSKAPIDAKTVDIKICGLDECDIESDVIISEITESGSSQIADLKIKNGEPYSISVKVDAYYALISDKDSIFFKVTEDGVKLCNIENHDLSTADCDIASDIFKTNGFEISIDNCTDKKEPETIALVEVPKDTENVESKTINNVPSTGVSTKAYLIGSLVMLIGAGTVVVAKKKENM